MKIWYGITVGLATIIPPKLTYFCIHQEPQTLELLRRLVDHYPGLGKSVLLYIHLVIVEMTIQTSVIWLCSGDSLQIMT